MEIWHSIILGIVEGLTEFLPISSTGHLILAGELLGVAPENFSKTFDIVIQLGAIASVLFLYWRKIFRAKMLGKLVVAFIPTGVIGLLLYKVLKTYLLGSVTVVLWSLFVGGLILIAFELWYKKREVRISRTQDVENVSYKQAFAIGLFQSISIIPGVSRSAATIIGGLISGVGRTTIVEFSFLLAVPTILAASGYDLVNNHSYFSMDEIGALAVGFAVSFVIALGTIKFFLNFVKKYTFVPFGIYRVLIAILFAMLVV